MTLASPLAIQDDFKNTLQSLLGEVEKDMSGLISYAKASETMEDFNRIIFNSYPQLYAQYTNASELLTTTYYDTLRANALINASSAVLDATPVYTAQRVIEPAMSLQRGRDRANYAVSLIRKGREDHAVTSAFKAGVNEAVFVSSWDTMNGNGTLDGFAKSIKRVPNGQSCAWCLMCSTVVDEDDEQRYGSFHSHCKCMAVSQFTNQLDLDFQRREQKEFSELYTDLRGNGEMDYKEILKIARQDLGYK